MERKIVYYIREIEDLKAGKFVYPPTCEIDPSNKCMLSCKFCLYASHLKKNNDLLDMDLYLDLLKDLKEHGTRSITFTGGGEPLIHPRFNDMVDFAFDSGFEVGLVTNGVLLNTINAPERFTFIRVSIDAWNAEMYVNVKGKHLMYNVLDNIRAALAQNATVGLSYVICEENCEGLENAAAMAKDLGVAYIQFKPAWINGGKFIGYELPKDDKVIETDRYVAEDDVPCKIAGLVGVVGADSFAYFCCQFRGDAMFALGSLKYNKFSDLWRMRSQISPDISKCPQCRYMNYVRAYNSFVNGGSFIFRHRNFL